jgi:hypothetical protein
MPVVLLTGTLAALAYLAGDTIRDRHCHAPGQMVPT